MAIRTDVTVDWDQSPRIITVLSPSVKISMQDLLDTLRSKESETFAMDNKPIVSASGKEELTDIDAVGLTVKLLNAKVGFEARDGTEQGGVDEWVLCTLGGGNCVAVDSDGQKMDARNPTSFTTIDRTLSSSATITIVSTGGSALTTEEHDHLMTRPSAEELKDTVLDEVGA